MPKILLLNNDRKLAAKVKEIAPDWEVELGSDSPPGTISGDADVVAVAGFGRTVTEIIKKSPNMRWVQTWSAGVDAVPLDTLKERGIYLTNVSGVHPKPISESIFSLMLSFARGIHLAEHAQREAKWANSYDGFWDGLWEIHGQTLGILGAGKIGAEAAKIAKAFDMHTIGLVRNLKTSPPFDKLTTELDYVLENSDFVVNILPLTKATRSIINADAFAKMKPNAVYITVGRGPTTDFAALRDALERKIIAYAGADVTEPEPLPDGDPLWSLPNIIVMPHIAGSTQFYQQRAGEIFLENLKSFVETGAPCRNIVNLDEGY